MYLSTPRTTQYSLRRRKKSRAVVDVSGPINLKRATKTAWAAGLRTGRLIMPERGVGRGIGNAGGWYASSTLSLYSSSSPNDDDAGADVRER